MTTDATGRMKIVIYYAIWATICAAVAGLVITGLHTWLFSYIPNRSGLLVTVLSDAVTALAIAAGQGAVALVTGSVLAQFGEGPQRTVLLRLLLPVLVPGAVLGPGALVRRGERELGDDVVGSELGRERGRVGELERHEAFPLRRERRHVGDEAAAGVGALADADRQRVAGN